MDRRFPVTSTWKAHLFEYYAPKNFNFWYFFGSLALLVLVLQIVTGIFLVMHYKPDAERAFQSVEYIMREVPWGWLVRYMHSTGASMFFVVVYLHTLRGLLYGSYRKPRELVWIFGVAIFLCLMAEAFFGYLLPWGQMSYWGAQVIVNLFAAIPFIGPELSIWIRGDYVVSDATLNRFFAFHVIAIPLVLVGLVAAHLVALHEVGSNNPDGVEIKQGPKAYGRPKDGIPFHPFYTVHLGAGGRVRAGRHRAAGQEQPEGHPARRRPRHPDRRGRAAARSTPSSGAWSPWAAPWSFCSSSRGWTIRRSSRSATARPGTSGSTASSWSTSSSWATSAQPPSPPLNLTSQIGTLLYLAFFFLMPVWSRLGTFKPVPERVTFQPH